MNTTQAAGGVVLNASGQVLVVNQNGNSWSLPKGHPEPGESLRQAAEREILEESGIQELTYIQDLGEYKRYKIGKDIRFDDKSELKTITMFLFSTTQERLAPLDKANPEAIWVDVDSVEGHLTHPKDKEFFSSIKNQLQTER